METSGKRVVGFCLSDKKLHKLRWDVLVEACTSRGFSPVKLDLDKPLELQGPINVLIHKLTDIIVAADSGDIKAVETLKNVEKYINDHPEIVVIDPIENVKMLLNRYKYYSLIESQSIFSSNGIFTPSFCILKSNSLKDNINSMLARKVTFPVVCKMLTAHGSKSAHTMSVIFNESGLSHCKTPCVVQSFINHNAVLYKVFVIGNRYYITERPSLKNFYACNERETIHFHSGDVCKADSQSLLSILDPHEASNIETKVSLDEKKIEIILHVLRKELNLSLFGIDIVIDNKTNNYGIIDINFYPGYDEFPDYFGHLIDCVDEMAKDSTLCKNTLYRVYKNNEQAISENERVSNKQQLINLNIEKIEDFYEKI